MAAYSISTDPGVDLTECDREPIHIPGSIQPHGLLLIADSTTMDVIAGAGDIEGRLSPDWLGQSLSSLLHQDVTALVTETMGIGTSVVGRLVRTDAERLDVTIHRAGDRLLVELEPAADQPARTADVLGSLDAVATGFERATDLQTLCDRAAVAFRALTGFDRVMVYRFLDDEAGRVVAEDRDPSLSTFMHHHFPASDIPRQARALYVRNRTRAIPTVTYDPQPIRPAAHAGTDLSDVAVRAVSPIHLQYLRNMGVGASASISIVKDGILWGLIACHHHSPRYLHADTRMAAAMLAAGLARQIRAREEAETYRERLRLRAAEDAVVPQLSGDPTLAKAIERATPELRAMLGADGLALVDGRHIVCEGECPPQDAIADIAEWARHRGGVEPIVTHELSTVMPGAQAYADKASGVLALSLPGESGILIWFRIERIEEVEWAGNPHKSVGITAGEQLTPRASFETWTEAVRGRARRWTLEEVEAAHRLRRVFRDVQQARELDRLNGQLRKTLAEKEVVLEQKDLLMKEVDHRIQNSLQLVSAFLSMQARSAPAEVAQHLREAQARLGAVAQVHRRLYRDDRAETIDLARYLEELSGDMKASLGIEWSSRMKLDLAPVLIPSDRSVSVDLVMTELVINATKYAYGGEPGPISITLEQYRAKIRLIVADVGQGKTGDNSGFGSRMISAMVAKLDGELDLSDNQPGLRAILTAPLETPRTV